MANGKAKETKPSRVEKDPPPNYKVLGKLVGKVEIKERLTDTDFVDFYVYDLKDVDGKCIALNRYVLAGNILEQPFHPLTGGEELILNPPIVVEEK